MLSITWLLSIILPIGFVVAGTVLIRKRGNPDTVEQRYFLFLAWTAIGMSVPIFVNWIFPHLRFSIGVFCNHVVVCKIVAGIIRQAKRMASFHPCTFFAYRCCSVSIWKISQRLEPAGNDVADSAVYFHSHIFIHHLEVGKSTSGPVRNDFHFLSHGLQLV